MDNDPPMKSFWLQIMTLIDELYQQLPLINYKVIDFTNNNYNAQVVEITCHIQWT